MVWERRIGQGLFRLVLLTAALMLGAGQGNADEQDADGNLAAQAQNPIANLISLPFEQSTGFGVGPENGTVGSITAKPVIPFGLTEDWNVITRTIIPVIRVPGSVEGLGILPEGEGSGTSFGLGDINTTAWISPSEAGKVIWGIGPSMTVPTATDSLLGTQKLSLGPSIVVLVQPEDLTVGLLSRQLWSVAGKDNRTDVNQFLLQPILTRNLWEGWYLNSSPVMTADFNADEGDVWTVPVGGGFGKIFRIGNQPVNAKVTSYYNVLRPTNGPDWSLNFQLTFLFPQ